MTARGTRALIALMAVAALAGCSVPASFSADQDLNTGPAPASTGGEPAWGKGWVTQDAEPVLRPDAASSEQLANQMAAGAPYGWTGRQADCLDELWMKVSSFDNFYRNDLFNGIAGLSGYMTDPHGLFGDAREDREYGWFRAQPGLQIAQGLIDIQVFWGTPCAEWARDAPSSVPAGTYPLWSASTTGLGYHGFAGSMDFNLIGGRLALTAASLESLCGPPGPAPACSWITQLTTWPGFTVSPAGR